MVLLKSLQTKHDRMSLLLFLDSELETPLEETTLCPGSSWGNTGNLSIGHDLGAETRAERELLSSVHRVHMIWMKVTPKTHSY